ncbi:MAG TPA: TIGR00730 family Rossman fold protein [Planctomycetota bacterium]|nr:TIGR00730 family Rossman fold protein [Planctomycetota bacterium]
MTAICVFCGSSNGIRPTYTHAAQALGKQLGQRGVRLVYGAANCGLMAAVADATLTAGGTVEGVIPEVIDRMDLTHANLTRLHKVGTMHERKALMAELSDAFIALPGGIGTLDELCEIICWAQLAIHTKPVGLLNTDGYYDGLLAFMHHAVAEGFMRRTDVERLIVAQEPADLLQRLLS